MKNYALLVSQRAESYICIPVFYDLDDQEISNNIKKMTEDLELHKSCGTRTDPFVYGDFQESRFVSGLKLHRRRNVNDYSGDIYFIPCETVESMFQELEYFPAYRSSSFDPFHMYEDIKSIVSKYFEVI